MSLATGSAPVSPLARAFSNLVRSPLFFVFTAFFGSLSLMASFFEKDGRLQHRIARQWARVSVLISGGRLTVIGRENLLPLAVYASNHTSFMDTPLVFSSLPFQFRILAKQSLWRWPFIGWHLRRSGQIPVDEESGTVSGLNQAIRVLKTGMPLFIFPEGGRTEDGTVQEFMKGPAYIAIRARVPVVPMALIGAYELLPIHSHHFRPGPILLVIGRPIDSSTYGIRQVGELTQRVREEIIKLYDQRFTRPELRAKSTSHPNSYEPQTQITQED
jgi:1-acyl-sn-glycerol-3-phosphate acyltransferase